MMAPPKIPLEQRFWARVDRRGEDECWPWIGTLLGGRYGVITTTGTRKYKYAHRLAWELANDRDIPAGQQIRHSCDNMICVNPAHLSAGTHADNMADKTVRRRIHGERNPNAKLTDAQVADIRSRYTGKYGERTALAREFGVSTQHVWQIATGRIRHEP